MIRLKERRPKIYIAGPYSKPDPIINTKVAIEVADTLHRIGFSPYIPHLTAFWHFVSPKPIGFWYDHDLEWLSICVAMYRIGGDSAGADMEERYASMWNIPIIMSLDEAKLLYERWLNGRSV